MAIRNSEGCLISFDSSKLLKNLKNIIKIDGKNCSVLVNTTTEYGVQLITAVYPLDTESDENLYQMTARDCYLQLKKQGSIT